MLFQNALILIKKVVRSNSTMFVMEILEEIVVHFSFDMIRTFASFSGHTLSVVVLRHCLLKLPKNIRDMRDLPSDKSLLLFLLQGR